MLIPQLAKVFREASWDEALDTAADGFKKLKDSQGGASVAGFGSAKCTNEEAYLFKNLSVRALGTMLITVPGFATPPQLRLWRMLVLQQLQRLLAKSKIQM